MRDGLSRINPLFKMLLLISFTVNLFLIDSWQVLLSVLGSIVVLMILLRIRLGMFKYMIILMAVSTPVTMAIFLLSGFELSSGSFAEMLKWVVRYYGIFMLRVMSLVLSNIIFVRTTSLKDITGVLRGLGVSEKITLFIVTLVRVIPLSIEHGKRIIDVQRARGLKLKTLYRPKGLMNIVVPLFMWHLKMVGDMALMLEIRYFSWTGRGVKRDLSEWVSVRDLGALAAAIAMFFLPGMS
ncbi:MAG: hypothetical protein GF408_07540 [Candidatus Omnitrophica bacterium]|nr:hypothetical protein [Candidatus Omnitrophota bacterium]